MRNKKQSIRDCEIMAGLQYTLYESYAILIVEQLKKSKDIEALNKVLDEVKASQSKAFDEWLKISAALSKMVEEEYHIDLVTFQLSSHSLAGTKRFKDFIRRFEGDVHSVQRMVASEDTTGLDARIKSLSGYVPSSKGTAFTLHIFKTQK